MASITLHPHLTPARERWLRQLLDGPSDKRPPGRIRWECMQLGWTEQATKIGNNFVVGLREAREKFGERFWDRDDFHGYFARLTDDGRKALNEGTETCQTVNLSR